jgi:hypothetical protein
MKCRPNSCGVYSPATKIKLMRHFLRLVAIPFLTSLFVILGFFAALEPFCFILDSFYTQLFNWKYSVLIWLLSVAASACGGAAIGFVLAQLLLRKMKIISEMPTKFLERLFPNDKN